jgi:hypothetical protein
MLAPLHRTKGALDEARAARRPRVLPSHQGRGLGFELVRETVEPGPFKDLLHTAYASGLYEKFGFEMRSDYLMERPPPE